MEVDSASEMHTFTQITSRLSRVWGDGRNGDCILWSSASINKCYMDELRNTYFGPGFRPRVEPAVPLDDPLPLGIEDGCGKRDGST